MTLGMRTYVCHEGSHSALPIPQLSLNPWIDDFERSSAGFGELCWGVDALARV